MKKIFFNVLMLFILLPALLSQNKDSLIRHTPKFSIQFQIGDNFSLSPFRGFDIAGKYSFNDKLAARIGIGYNLYYKTGNHGTNSSDLFNWNNSIQINTALIYNLNTKSDFIPFLGIGPVTSIGISHSEDTISFNDGNGFALGLNFIGGVEWFPLSYIGISGEVGLLAFYSHSKSKRNNYSICPQEIVENEFNEILIQGDTFKLGLSVYF